MNGRRTSLVAALALTAGLLVAGNVSHAAAPAQPTVGLVPFRNVTGDPSALPAVMAELERELVRRQWRVEGNGGIDRFLREHRIRARDAMAMDDARALAATIGARYLLVGAIDAWAMNGGPEIGLTARLLDTVERCVVWADEVTLHAVAAPGLLASRRPKTLERAVRPAVGELLARLSLVRVGDRQEPRSHPDRPRRSMLASVPITFRNPKWNPRRRLRIAVLPLDNHTRTPDAPLVIGDRLLSRLLAVPQIDVVDPGELRRTLIENDLQPLYGVTPSQAARLAQLLELDAVLDGSILYYGNGAGAPRIDLFARLRDARTGEILWAATTSRGGERTRTVYDVGRIRGLDRLAEATVSDLLSTLVR